MYNYFSYIGIATTLLKSVESYAMKNKYKEIYLHVETDNIKAKNLYLKNDYIEVPKSDWATIFTMSRLHKPVCNYILLWKQF